jgi:hypothetical protein
MSEITQAQMVRSQRVREAQKASREEVDIEEMRRAVNQSHKSIATDTTIYGPGRITNAEKNKNEEIENN